jgi:uncharacterized protein YdhG (YjbR/CyaY superfamily)
VAKAKEGVKIIERYNDIMKDKKVDEYIDKQKSPQKEILQKLRKLIQKSAPSATEAMSYGVPAFKLNGNLILYAAFTSHIGIYPEPDTIKVFAKDLAEYETAKGTIKFYLDKPIPYGLIEKIVKYRVQMKLENNKRSH